MDNEQPKIEVVYDNTMIVSSQVTEYWKPTSVLRWRKEYTNNQMTSYDKVLQQMWQGSLGTQEWKDVPEED